MFEKDQAAQQKHIQMSGFYCQKQPTSLFPNGEADILPLPILLTPMSEDKKKKEKKRKKRTGMER